MAMNNWGGVKEHMAKKPRKFFSQNRVRREFNSDSNTQLTKEKINEADNARKKSIQREMVIYLILFVFIAFGIIIFIKYF